MALMHGKWKTTAKKINAELRKQQEMEAIMESMVEFSASFPTPSSAQVQLTMRETLRRLARPRMPPDTVYLTFVRCFTLVTCSAHSDLCDPMTVVGGWEYREGAQFT